MPKRQDLRSIALGAGLIAAALIVDGWLPIGVFVGEPRRGSGAP